MRSRLQRSDIWAHFFVNPHLHIVFIPELVIFGPNKQNNLSHFTQLLLKPQQALYNFFVFFFCSIWLSSFPDWSLFSFSWSLLQEGFTTSPFPSHSVCVCVPLWLCMCFLGSEKLLSDTAVPLFPSYTPSLAQLPLAACSHDPPTLLPAFTFSSAWLASERQKARTLTPSGLSIVHCWQVSEYVTKTMAAWGGAWDEI